MISREQFDKIDYYLDIIYCLGKDYDGCETAESLARLIDELVTYSDKARRVLHNKET